MAQWRIGAEPDQLPEGFVFSGSEEDELEIDYTLVVYSQCASQRLSIIACVQKMKKMQSPWI